ncbi:lysylphosphatidylglycerol synthase transmembrane domain-containing protein [Brevibacillus dissolubilis]|uniref:lysylphosphatidylglycerol synthase transmembrane domain-containing protein n=1 Tax=Brevibacillus dissolubilis TaxID=1844116 RepID=UPI00159BDEC0|nr:lysylphosphatidylglycerol synthase transmembrane domain-containing protein [Brevibacillus dissolubilis]
MSKKVIITSIAWLLLGVSIYWAITKLNWHELLQGIVLLGQKWPLLLLMSVGYAAAFWLRSLGWAYQMQQQRVGVNQLWLYHHIGLLLNHVLPVKGGEVARMALLRTRENFTWAEAAVSVAISRILDMAGLLIIGAFGFGLFMPERVGQAFGTSIGWLAGLTVILTVGIVLMLRLPWQKWLAKKKPQLALQWDKPRASALLLTALGWMLEAVVVFSVVIALGGQLGVGEALFVHVLTIIGQTFHVTPGGIGTYETVMSGLLTQVAGHSLSFALQVAILTHGFKFIYSFVLGGYAAWRLSLSPLALYQQAVAKAREEGQA